MVKNNRTYETNKSLQGKFLISSPTILDNRFTKSAILITSHNSTGATGIIVNKPSAYQFNHIINSVIANFNEKDINLTDEKISIVLGGPANPSNLFVLHSAEYLQATSVKVTNDIYMTNQPSTILDLAKGVGPKKAIIAIGCAAWQAGQLEKELSSDSWFLYDPSFEDIFNPRPNKIYEEMFILLGIPNTNQAFFVSNTYKT
ncbi:YqgE/AlgH family protein [Candidatus Hepatincolaceae symbiont of Richtersius coronifer]